MCLGVSATIQQEGVNSVEPLVSHSIIRIIIRSWYPTNEADRDARDIESPELKVGHKTETVSAAAQRPEEICVRIIRCRVDDVAV